MNKIIYIFFIIFMAVFFIGYENAPARTTYGADINSRHADNSESHMDIKLADAAMFVSRSGSSSEKSAPRRVRLVFKGGEAVGVLYDNVAADSLYAQLPVTIKFSDFGRQEKIAYFPQKFTLEGAPRGSNNQAGDICIYAPWGNLAIFYVDTEYSTSLIPLGRIESGLELLAAKKTDFDVTVEAVK